MALNPKFMTSSSVKKLTLQLTLTDGEVVEQEVYLRKMTSAEFQTVVLIEQSADPEKAAQARARMIAMAIVEADGKTPICTEEEAAALDPLVAGQLALEITRNCLTGKVTAL